MNIPSFALFRSLSLVLAAAGALSSVASVQAEVITAYAGLIGLNTTTGVIVPSDWADHVFQPSNLSPSAGISGSGNQSNGEAYYGGWDATLTLEKYVSFTVSAESGYVLNLTDFSFRTMPRTTNGPVTSYTWGYRVNEGTGFGGWTLAHIYTDADSNYTTPLAKSWNFADFSTTGTVEFGLFATTNSEVNDELTVRTATLNGTVTAVPEPSTYALVGLGLLAALAVYRRRLSASV